MIFCTFYDTPTPLVNFFEGFILTYSYIILNIQYYRALTLDLRLQLIYNVKPSVPLSNLRPTFNLHTAELPYNRSVSPFNMMVDVSPLSLIHISEPTRPY